jgi:hypothetical protein
LASPLSTSTATDVSNFDGIENTFRTAQAAFVIPEEMVAGRSSHVHLDLSFQKTLAELQQDLQLQLDGPNDIVRTAFIRSSSIAQARLTGQDFEITAITPEEQPVDSKTTTWEWEVRPKSSGSYPLHLSIDAVVTIGPNSLRKTVQTLERLVVVHVSIYQSARQFVSGNWQWLWTTVAAPIGGVMWAMWRRKTKRKSRG